MHLNAKPPVLVPYKHWAEIEKLSKAALMDMVWSLAGQTVESAEDESDVMARIREERATIERCRNQADGK